MTSKSRRKGNEYERELVNQATASGLAARRAWGSNGESLGLDSEVDLTVENYKIQAKRRKELPQYLKPSENVDIQVVREDHGRSLAVVDWYLLLDLFKLAQGSQHEGGQS